MAGDEQRAIALMDRTGDCGVARQEDEAAQVTGGISGALDSVVSTENGRSVLLSDEASPGRDLHRGGMIGQVTQVGNDGVMLFLRLASVRGDVNRC